MTSRSDPYRAYHSVANKKPRATSWRWTACEHCPNAHLVLEDENGEPFADMTLSREQIDHFNASRDRAFDDAANFHKLKD